MSRKLYLSLSALTVVTVLDAWSPAHSEPLVINGEEIASSELFEAAKAEGKLVIYGTLPARNFEVVEASFEAATGIDVEYINLVTPKLYARATAEFAAGKLLADWVDSTDLPLAQQLVTDGILTVGHKVPSFDAMPENLRDEEGRWYSVFRTPIIVGINTAVVAEGDRPKSWADLLDPKWNDRMGITTIDAGGSWFNAFAFLKEKVDPEYWEKLAAIKPRIYPTSAPMLTDLVRGETVVSLSAPASIKSQIQNGAPVEVLFPTEGVSAYATTGGITATAPNPNAAKVYLNWVTSVQGGNSFSPVGIYAIHPDATPPSDPVIPFPNATELWSMSVGDWMEKREAYTAEWRSTFGQN